MTVKGRPVSRNPNNFLINPAYQQVFRDAHAANFSGQSHLSDMDKEGVDVGILLPTAGMYAIWSDHIDAPLAAAMARAYNNYLADYCKTDKTRLKGIALLPLQNIEESVIELRRAVKDLGFVAAFMRACKRLFRRAALFGWCSPLRAARSIFDTAVRYVSLAISVSPLSMDLTNFLIWVRMVARCAMFWARLTFS